MKLKIESALACVLISAVLAVAAVAQTGPGAGQAAPPAKPRGPNAPNDPCKADREKLCADVAPGGGQVARCLREHHDELSAQCKTAMETRAQRGPHKGIAQICKDELAKFCPDARGPQAITKCLSTHEGKLSAACKSRVEWRRKNAQGGAAAPSK